MPLTRRCKGEPHRGGHGVGVLLGGKKNREAATDIQNCSICNWLSKASFSFLGPVDLVGPQGSSLPEPHPQSPPRVGRAGLKSHGVLPTHRIVLS